MKTAIATLVLASVAACSGNVSKLTRMDPAAYAATSSCWTEDGLLKVFAIFDEAGEGYVPSFISYRCIPVDKAFSGPEAYIPYLNAFRVTTSTVDLRKFGFEYNIVFSNDSVEFVVPSDDSNLYFISAVIEKKQGKRYIKSIRSVSNTNMHLGQFLDLEDDEVRSLGVKFAKDTD